MTTIRTWMLLLGGLAISSAAFGLEPALSPQAYACIEFKPGTAVLSDAGEKTLDNFADLIKRQSSKQGTAVLGEFMISYSFSPDEDPRLANGMPDFDLAFAREQAVLNRLSAGIADSNVPNIPVWITTSAESSKTYCKIQISSPFGYAGMCDENGCSQ